MRSLGLIVVIGSAAAISLATLFFAILERRLVIAAAEICFAGAVATIGWAWAARQPMPFPLTGILMLSYVVLAAWGRRRARRTSLCRSAYGGPGKTDRTSTNTEE